MVDRFINSTPLQQGESLIGFILRLTELNYYDKPSRITSLAGLPNIFAITPSAPMNLTLLAKLADVPLEELQCRTYSALRHHSSPFTGVVSFFGHPVAHSIIRNENTKICPICLQEFGYCRAVWDLLPVTTCPLHGCLLMRHCPNCKNRISSKRRKLGACGGCNFDWRNSAVTLVDVTEIRLSNLVHQRLQLPVSTKPGAVCADHNPLVFLDLLCLFTAVLFLAGECEGFRDIAGRTWDSRGEDLDPHTSIVKAMSIFNQWPYGFWGLLDELRYEDEEGNRPGVKGIFGEFYRTLFARLTSRPFEFMRSAFRHYLEENPIFRSDERRSTIGRACKKYLSKPEAQRRLGGARMVNSLIQAGKLKTITARTSKNRKVVLVEAKGARIVQRQFATSLNTKETAKKLGISGQSVTDLIEQKCLQPLRGPSVDRYPSWRFKPATINDLKRKIRKRIVEQNTDSETITFHHALKIVQRIGYDVGKFVRALLDGQIAPCNSNPGGKILKDLNFSKRQISQWADQIVENLNGDSVYVKEAACILKLNAGAVISMCTSGLIDGQQARGYARKGFLISRRSLQDFSANHVRAADLANGLNTNSATIIKILAAKGIKPITAIRRDKHPQYIFRKEDVQNVAWVQVRNEINVRGLRSMPAKTFDLTETATLIGCAHKTIRVLVDNDVLKPTSRGTKEQRQMMDYVFTARAIKNYLRQFGGRTDVVSGKVATKMLNESSVTFHNSWVKSGRLKKFETNAKCGRLCYFLYEDIKAIAMLKNRTLTTVETTQLLGISQQQLIKLSSKGILTPVSGPRIDGCGRNRYLSSAVNNLAAKRPSTPENPAQTSPVII